MLTTRWVENKRSNIIFFSVMLDLSFWVLAIYLAQVARCDIFSLRSNAISKPNGFCDMIFASFTRRRRISRAKHISHRRYIARRLRRRISRAHAVRMCAPRGSFIRAYKDSAGSLLRVLLPPLCGGLLPRLFCGLPPLPPRAAYFLPHCGGAFLRRWIRSPPV